MLLQIQCKRDFSVKKDELNNNIKIIKLFHYIFFSFFTLFFLLQPEGRICIYFDLNLYAEPVFYLSPTYIYVCVCVCVVYVYVCI
jgi:hypothetical protein